MSMATKSSDLDDQKTGVNIQNESHTLIPPSGQSGPEEIEAFGSTPSYSLSPVFSMKTNTLPPWDSVLFGNTSDHYWRWQNYTTTSTCLADASCGGHGLRWQIQPNRSSIDWPRPSCPVLWVAIFRRRTELVQDARSHVHTGWSHQLAWLTGPAQCQSSKPGWRLVVDCPSHHQMMHQTQRTWMSSLHSALIITILLLQSGPVYMGSKAPNCCWTMGDAQGMVLGHHTRNEAKPHRKAKNEAGGNGSYGLPHPITTALTGLWVSTSSSVSLWSDRSGDTRHSHHGQQCYTESGVIWRSTCQSSRMKTWRMPSPTKGGTGI